MTARLRRLVQGLLTKADDRKTYLIGTALLIGAAGAYGGGKLELALELVSLGLLAFTGRHAIAKLADSLGQGKAAKRVRQTKRTEDA